MRLIKAKDCFSARGNVSCFYTIAISFSMNVYTREATLSIGTEFKSTVGKMYIY